MLGTGWFAAVAAETTEIVEERGDDGKPATWGDHVTDEEYAAAPSLEA